MRYSTIRAVVLTVLLATGALAAEPAWPGERDQPRSRILRAEAIRLSPALQSHMPLNWTAALAATQAASSAAPLEQELADDVLLRALVDELDRSRAGLKLQDLERPYFIEFTLYDTASASVSARLGAVTARGENRMRYLSTGVRVGSYEFDNTNFGGGMGGFYFGGMGGYGGGAAIPLEDDYNAIRQAIWLSTDRDYKSAAEEIVQKRAFMESKVITDKPADFSREEPVVHFEARERTTFDLPALERLAVAVSEVFRQYPDIQNSSASIRGGGGNKYLVNTEGTRMRTNGATFSLTVSASTVAEDGMELADSFNAYAEKEDAFPPLDELLKRARDMADRLLAVRAAPLLDAYTGPVLISAEPAASLFSGQFSYRFAGGQRPVGSGTGPDDFAAKLGKRILPRFLDVVDDPTLEELEGKPVFGHYEYDDQGVPARRVSLVEEGKLKTLLMSRNPSKEFARSTGHGRGGWGSASASSAALVVTARDGVDDAGLRERLLEACEDEDLPFGLRIDRFGSVGGGGYGGGFSGFDDFEGYGGGGGGSTPLVMYKVFPDGREELVRPAQIGRLDLKSFKRMLAAGSKLHVENSGARRSGRTVAAPAMLFEEIDLTKLDRDFDTPPILPSPLARAR